MQRRHILAGGIAAAGLLPIAGTLNAQTAAVDPAKMPALMGGNYSMLTSQLALERANNEAVRIFAQLEATEQAAVANAFGVEPGTGGVSQNHAMLLEALRATQGPAFDVVYVDGQIEAHEELLAIHQQYAAQGADPMARGASIVGVPAIETHLAMLRGIRLQLN